jgi:hypothetical protein
MLLYIFLFGSLSEILHNTVYFVISPHLSVMKSTIRAAVLLLQSSMSQVDDDMSVVV